MDLFVDSLPEGAAMRLHFHRFMNQVHDRLTILHGTENPHEVIADEFASRSKVLCFDECFVSDITMRWCWRHLTDYSGAGITRYDQ